MIEINGQHFKPGDVVRFEHAGLPKNRTRDYTIDALTDAGIRVSHGEFAYSFPKATAARIGITHSPTSRHEDRP